MSFQTTPLPTEELDHFLIVNDISGTDEKKAVLQLVFLLTRGDLSNSHAYIVAEVKLVL